MTDRLPGAAVVQGGFPAAPAGPVTKAPRPRRRGRRPAWTAEQLDGDPTDILSPYAEQVTGFARSQRYEDAARVRDEAERLRLLLARHRRVESLRRVGRMVLLVDGEGTVQLEQGLLVEAASLFDDAGAGGGGSGSGSGGLDPAFIDSGDGHENERVLVANWLQMHADRVRVLEVEGSEGLALRAERIPELAELCGGNTSAQRQQGTRSILESLATHLADDGS